MITLTREEAQELLNALTMFCRPNEDQVDELVYEGAIELLRARLSAPEPVPTGFIRTLVKIHTDGTETWKDEPFYTTPPQREWQGLTDEEIYACSDTPWTPTGLKCIRAIEEKLKEKNS